ncbi:proline-rich protein 22 isoform X2 [Heteronotia binoei]|uniref:proline-rich protein 22 isoform X2 n=1 Tax=Heteronotia binoei TaxID=13085 RepID=UPI00292ED23D|nr:proline-rich protein 22 isoform X2 [Heteronotia binoei]
MHQPKLFYPDHETYAPRVLDRPDNQPNRPFPAFVLPENLASVGFHMAPCGCFFDPRIYRIEWATANFVQPSVYKLSGGLSPQSTYLLDSQKYLKGPIQPVPYPPYQPISNNPPFVLPFFKPERPAPNLTEQISFISKPLQGSPFVEAPHLPSEGLVQSKDHPLQATVPGLTLKEQPAQTETYNPLKEHPVDPSSNSTSTNHDLLFQDTKNLPVQGEESRENDTNSYCIENPTVLEVHSESQSPVGVPFGEIITELDPCMDLEDIITNKNNLLGEQEPFDLPEKVLLEDAMKLFDCSPVTEDDPENGTLRDSYDNGCFPCEDSSSDIQSLNLPDELLSFDYSVPEILGTVTSLDYLYDVNAFREDLPWENKVSPQGHPKHRSHSGAEEKRKDGAVTARKGRSVAYKPQLASALVK